MTKEFLSTVVAISRYMRNGFSEGKRSRWRPHWWILVCAGIFFVSGSGCTKTESFYTSKSVMMGTFVEVQSAHPEAGGIVFAEFKKAEKLFSKYMPQSDIGRLNRDGRATVDPQTIALIKKAGEFFRSSQGAFDITVGPLIDLWGFTDRKYRVPSEDEITRALALVGYEKISIDETQNVVEFSIPGMKIDLGGIAKGYALDCAVRALKDKGITSCLINAGGQVYCLGTNKGEPWKVAIKDPRREGVIDYLEVSDASVATSGDYEQYFLTGNIRYSHILDPRTGYPADNNIVSVTIVSPDATSADALSTAVFVLGKEKGLEVAGSFGRVRAYIFEETDIIADSF